MKKEHILHASVNRKIYNFIDDLSKIEGSKSFWIKEAIKELAKKYNWNASKTVQEHEG